MTFRTRLLLAQAPLAAALLLVGAASLHTVFALGQSAERSLEDNYRSAVAAQRMSAALERMNRDAILRAIGWKPEAAAEVDRERFETELRAQHENITEPGEEAATRRLHEVWEAYRAEDERASAAPDPAAAYFGPLQRARVAVQAAADEILSLNDAAMERKSHDAKRTAMQLLQILIAATAGALALGLFASSSLTTRTLADLTRAQQSAQAAIESLHHPVLILDATGTLLDLNATAESLLGVRRGDVQGRPLGALALEPALRDRLDAARAHVVAAGAPLVPHRLEEAVSIAREEGPRRFLPQAAALRSGDGTAIGVTIVLQDVTRLARFDELRNDLVATVAHEFRTPLTSLQMAVHLCADGAAGPLTEEQGTLMAAARKDCVRLLDIVDEILDLSRIQTGKLEVQPRPFEADRLLELAASAARDAARAATVDLEVARAGSLAVLADAERVELVIANLLANAIRHSPPAGRVVACVAAADRMARFEVRDAGPGIPLQYVDRIFERYFRVPGSKRGGVGLGLYIAREIVEAHGGAIGVEATPGRGSTFWFTLPLATPGA